jgi:hypothetical protein
MNRQVVIKKTWLSAFSYAQSRISLDFCRSLGFLVHWSSSLTAESDLADILCYVWRRREEGVFFYFFTFKMVLKLNFMLFSYLYGLKIMRQRQHLLAG